ncbi:MAG: MFS transporter [Oscillospiraceae bacterium]|nr:MFS transporter [Oscillospiraceae bacterium]
MSGKVSEYRVYSYRWVVLAVYLLAAAVIQLLWATYFSITTAAWQFYGFADAAKGESAISLLSIIFMAGMIVLSVPSFAAFERWGFYKAVGAGAVLMGICGVFRGVFGGSYAAVIVTTLGFAVAQPFILNAPGLVAGKWFPENERATANGAGLLANYLGMAVGLLLTPVLLQNGMDVKAILLVYGGCAAVSAVLFLAFAREHPPTPPCSVEAAVRANFKEGFRTALQKKNFMGCVLIFFCLLGVFNTFFTMIEPILGSMTGGTVDATGAGIVGVVILVTGIVGSLAVSVLSDRDKRRARLPYLIGCNIIGLVGFALFILLHSFAGMVAAGAVYGLFTIGSAPVLLTFAAEEAYPTSEGTSEGLLMLAGNIGGVVLLGLASLFRGNHLALLIFMAVLSAACVVRMLFAKETKLQNK